MIKPIKEINDFLSVLRVLLTRGLIDKEEVISWADHEITKMDKPDDYLIELSLIGTKTTNEIFELIYELSDNSKSLISGRALIGIIGSKIKDRIVDYKKGFEVLYSVQLEFELTDLEKNYINHADDEIKLAINQVCGDKYDVQKRVKTFLKCYEGFTLDNIDTWRTISNEVTEKLSLWDKKLV